MKVRDQPDNPQVGEGDHFSFENQTNPLSLHDMNMDLTYKIRLKVLKGKFDPEPKDSAMIRKYRESGLPPEDFLKTWKETN